MITAFFFWTYYPNNKYRHWPMRSMHRWNAHTFWPTVVPSKSAISILLRFVAFNSTLTKIQCTAYTTALFVALNTWIPPNPKAISWIRTRLSLIIMAKIVAVVGANAMDAGHWKGHWIIGKKPRIFVLVGF